jgi:peptidyl-prolyl cis-trans isomerase SurA
MTDSRSTPGHRTAKLAPLCTVLTALTLLLAPPAGAQSPVLKDGAPTVSPRIPGSRSFSTELKIQGVQTTSDYIVAVVNQEPITHTEIDKRVIRIQDTAQPGTRLPPTDELRQQVLEALIDEKVQAAYARAAGMDVNDNEVDAAIENIAGQNQLSLTELKQRMAADGLDFVRYRNSLRDQLLLQRVREREVNNRIQLSDNEIDEFLKTDPSAQNEVALNVAHILIAVPKKPAPCRSRRCATRRWRCSSGPRRASTLPSWRKRIPTTPRPATRAAPSACDRSAACPSCS